MRRLILVAVPLGVLALAVVASLTLHSQRPSEIEAGQPTDLPDVSAPGAPTAGPTLTPIPRPTETALISADTAQAHALSGEEAVESFESTLADAGDYPSLFASHEDDYPIWVITAHGRFRPFFGGPPGANARARVFSSATFYVDAITGQVMGEQLREEVDAAPAGAPSAAK